MANEIFSILKTCSTCKQSFSTLRELITHEKTHQQPAESSFGATSAKSLRPFLFKTDDTAILEDTWQCPDCPALIHSARSYYRHRRRWHSMAFDEGMNKEMMERLNDVWKYRCKTCSAAFAWKPSYNIHMRIVHGQVIEDHPDDGTSESDTGESDSEKPSTSSKDVKSSGRNKRPSISDKIHQKATKKSRISGEIDSRNAKTSKKMPANLSKKSQMLAASSKKREDKKISDNIDNSPANIPDNVDNQPSKDSVIRRWLTNDRNPKLGRTSLLGTLNVSVGHSQEIVAHSVTVSKSGSTDKSTNKSSIPQRKSRPDQQTSKSLSSKGSSMDNLCKYCLRKLSTHNYLLQHQTNLHYTATGNLKYFCDICTHGRIKIFFKNEGELLEHATSSHGIQIERDESGEIVQVIGVKESTPRPRGKKSKIIGSSSSTKPAHENGLQKNSGMIQNASNSNMMETAAPFAYSAISQPAESNDQVNVKNEVEVHIKEELEDQTDQNSDGQTSEAVVPAWRTVSKMECPDPDVEVEMGTVSGIQDQFVNVKEEHLD